MAKNDANETLRSKQCALRAAHFHKAIFFELFSFLAIISIAATPDRPMEVGIFKQSICQFFFVH